MSAQPAPNSDIPRLAELWEECTSCHGTSSRLIFTVG